ncbi:glycoside hydrolase family 18 [Bacteroides congonensis]|uniref:glycoside hydrolase family 18 n=1 Tax=Bacteroides congonensis TaxID=1871006 RepID=UPI00189CB94F|nr:glycoside hydrolase family 18 [Bacteroides congonensis]
MNKLVRNILGSILLFAGMTSCDTEIENIELQAPIVGSDSYYADLRAYKQTKHEIAFGWFGGWTASGAVASKYLTSVPDSVDIVGIWGDNWALEKMTPEKAADLKYVQEVKGTKVLGTILLGWVGKMLPEQEWPEDRYEALRLYAQKLAEMVVAAGLQGLDIDYEPYKGGGDDVRDCPVGEEFVVFVEELGKYLGPESGTGRLLVIDGELWETPSEIAKYFDYAIAQAYNDTRYELQERYDEVSDIFKPEQFVVTEDFERLWSKGGQIYNDDDYGRIPSLWGMAYWQPNEGRKGGCGTYHMEYEYNHPDVEYKYLRQAIQIMNPSKR